IGEMEPDEGTVAFSKETSFGYLAQNQNVSSENTIYEELLSVKQDLIDMERRIAEDERQMATVTGEALVQLMTSYTNLLHEFELKNGYGYKGEISGVLKGLGFAQEDFDQKISTLSGGQKTRVALGKLLLQKPDLIILDEPTNHLDLGSIRWLETYLMNYKGAVLIVSHDRYFLDRTVSRVIELEGTKATVFTGNYTAYAQRKQALREEQRRAWLNNQAQIRHQEEVIEKLRSFNREKSIRRAESREKLLKKTAVVEKPLELRDDMRLSLAPCIKSGREVLHVEDLAKSFGDKQLFYGLTFDIRRGEHVALIGDNGTGKTTILKILNGILESDAGRIRLGTNVHIGYYDQEHHVLHDDNTVFEEIGNAYPSMTNTQIRNLLASFLFTGEDVFKKIADLSGGEKGRVSLAKLMLSEANFLILDEPTNHLDMVSKEVLENALNSYEGTVLYVSHDRYFINRTASRILNLTHEVLVSYHGNNAAEAPERFIGNYDAFLEKSAQIGDTLLQNAIAERDALSPLAALKKAASEHLGRGIHPAGAGKSTGNQSAGTADAGVPGAGSQSADAGNAGVPGAGSQSAGAGNAGVPGADSSGGTAQADRSAAGGSDRAGGSSASPELSSGLSAAGGVSGAANASSSGNDWKRQKEEQARLRKQANALKKCEDDIAALEEKNKAIEEAMALPENCTNVGKLAELAREKEANDEALAALYEKWEELSE
ncbi:MAG: ATP-binding cassette domain-containing protein, partial [Eubacteriales bacterium]|nr:ATP-binding cassette domain-containing protein [Eubacteriales bacterium]